MLHKNQTLVLECAALGAEFEGICRHGGQVVFVPGALPGERVRARVVKVNKRYAIGRLEAVETPCAQRQAPPCPYYPRCGGCTAQHMRYEDTLAHKRQQVIDCLERIGGVPAPQVASALGMADPWRYRNKGAFPIGGAQGTPAIGMYAARSHQIIDMPQGCLLQSEPGNRAVRAVRRWMQAHGVAPYDEQAHTGLVRHVMTREARDGSVMLVLVCTRDDVPHADALIDTLRQAAPALRSVVLSVNAARTNVILGSTLRTLWGEGALVDSIAGFSFRVSPHTFFQVNRPQAEALYAHALALADLQGGETVWDLYCGCGTITLPLAARAAHVTGVEIVPAAIADAKENARQNGVANADFLAGAAEDILPALAARTGRPDVVVLDPPRKGCERTALSAILDAAPGRIVYVSCNPATLARDVSILRGGGYMLRGAQPVDMFGWTSHVECVVLLSHKSPDSHINVKVEFGEGEDKVPLDRIAERAKEYQPAPKVTC